MSGSGKVRLKVKVNWMRRNGFEKGSRFVSKTRCSSDNTRKRVTYGTSDVAKIKTSFLSGCLFVCLCFVRATRSVRHH